MAEVLIAGGYDHHNHPMLYHLLGQGIDISGTQTTEEAINKIAELIDSYTAEAVLVTGWNNSKYDLNQKDLEIFQRPVIAFNASFHGAIINTAAEKFLAFPKDTPGVMGNGVIVEQVIFATLDRLALDLEQNKQGLLAMQQEYFSLGIVAVDDMFINSKAQVQAYKELKDSGELKLKMKLWFRLHLVEQLAKDHPELLNLCEGVKFVLDGAFGVRTAALMSPYDDDQNNFGILLIEPWELTPKIRHMLELGVSKFAIHCIGDKASFIALNIYEYFAHLGVDTSGWRLEHAELITQKQAARAKKLGVILSMQPNFITDCQNYKDRLGDRVYRINPFRMLIEEVGFRADEDLLLGSDGMPTGLLHGLRCAVNGFTEAQSLGYVEAINSYTVAEPAPVTYVELSGDLLDPETKILTTVIDGEEVYKAS